MRRLPYLLLLLFGLFFLMACRNQVTYADQKKHERAAINKYIEDSAVTVISEEEFALKNYTTDVRKNEFVLFSANGVYMQIVEQGCGEKVKTNETLTLLCRYTERNLITDSIEASNMLLPSMGNWVDKISLTNKAGTFTGSFLKNHSTLVWAHSLTTTAVPEGWLMPLTYINVGRYKEKEDELARVRIIVPHDMGHQGATGRVIPYLYDITYERGN